MDMQGESRIEAPRERVWQALNDPEVLKASIAGCEELERTAENEFTAKVRAKVGPVSARFGGKVTLTDLDPPNGYHIQGEGQGGAAGFAKGGAEVRLEEDGAATILRYTAKATVGGKLAQIGSRLIDSTARKMADDFFARFKEHVEGPGATTGAPPPQPTVPGAGADSGAAAPPDLPVAPETERAPAADIAAPPGAAPSGPAAPEARIPSRDEVRPEPSATPAPSAPGPKPPSGPMGSRGGNPPPEPPREYGAAAAGEVSDGPGGYRAGMARLNAGNPWVWGIGILVVIVVLIAALG